MTQSETVHYSWTKDAHVYMHCFSLSRCFYCWGCTAHHKATNTASQPTEECALVDTIDSIILLLFLYKRYFWNTTVFPTVFHTFCAFISYRKLSVTLLFFIHNMFTQCTDPLYLYQLNELDPLPRVYTYILSNTTHDTLIFLYKSTNYWAANRTECKQLGSKVWLQQICAVVTDPGLD